MALESHRVQVDAVDCAVTHDDSARHHSQTGVATGTVEDKRAQWVVDNPHTEVPECESRQVGLCPNRDPPEVVAAEGDGSSESCGLKIASKFALRQITMLCFGELYAHIDAANQIGRKRIGTEAQVYSVRAVECKTLKVGTLTRIGKRTVHDRDSVFCKHVKVAAVLSADTGVDVEDSAMRHDQAFVEQS